MILCFFNVLRYQDIRINAGTLKFPLSAKNGSKKQMQLESFPKLEDMVELMRIMRLPWNFALPLVLLLSWAFMWII